MLSKTYSSEGQSLAITSGLIVRGFTEKTTSHGIPHVYFASGIVYRVPMPVAVYVGYELRVMGS